MLINVPGDAGPVRRMRAVRAGARQAVAAAVAAHPAHAVVQQWGRLLLQDLPEAASGAATQRV